MALAFACFVLLPLNWAEAADPGPTPTATPDPSEASGEVEIALPDLITLPPSDLRLIQNQTGSWRVVRFSNSIANIGRGPLEVIGQPGADQHTYQVRQRIYSTNGQLALEPLLTAIEYHPSHSHWHLADFARYELWAINADGSLRDVVAVSGKVSYCLMDIMKGEQGPDNERGYYNCGPTKQGLTAGWVDTYKSHVPGQFLDLSGLPNGVYAIRSLADPHDHIRESDSSNNDVLIYFRLTDTSVKVMPTPEDPWAGLYPEVLTDQDPLR